MNRSPSAPAPRRCSLLQIMVNGTDAKFLSKVQQLHGNHKHYIMPKRNNCPDPDTRNCFGVVHFAGDVFYNVRDFVEKNKVTCIYLADMTCRGLTGDFDSIRR